MITWVTQTRAYWARILPWLARPSFTNPLTNWLPMTKAAHSGTNILSTPLVLVYGVVCSLPAWPFHAQSLLLSKGKDQGISGALCLQRARERGLVWGQTRTEWKNITSTPSPHSRKSHSFARSFECHSPYSHIHTAAEYGCLSCTWVWLRLDTSELFITVFSSVLVYYCTCKKDVQLWIRWHAFIHWSLHPVNRVWDREIRKKGNLKYILR